MAKKPEVRVRHISEMPIQIVAADVQDGDVWVGEAADIAISKVTEGDTIDLMPWGSPVFGDPVPTVMVRIHGTITRSIHGDRGFTGTWSLAPDQPMEVLRRG